ncbi:hypothetical protein [Phycicoccus sp.]|uniref:hypothetical protein n=1 Tax=Phycicoccus sp. TaxID=1902410 RepID=UPI002C510D3F|nr:hypothetical protein [Phycicoccus sp.]HMM94511.1 hypothetical protein [Phycicoccus sp.]
MPSLTSDPPGPARTGRPVAVAVVVGAVTTAVLLLGSVGSRIRLVRDDVTVPDPARPLHGWFPSSAAELRAWPLDGVTWLLTRVAPSGVVQSGVTVLAVLGAGVGVGVLLRRHGAAAVVAGTVAATWNPYVAERLLVGQPAVLLGYAAIPWVVLVARSTTRLGRRLVLLALVAAPAAVTPWGGLVVLGVALAASASPPGRAWRDVLPVGLLGTLWCAPWLVPALVAGGVGADPDGAAAFALADDTGGGAWLSAVLGGGIWATGAVPGSRASVLALGCSLALLAAAVCGVVLVARRDGRRGVVAVLLLLGPATLLAVASGPALTLVTRAQAIAGVALFRDQHRLLAPAVVATAVLVGLVAGRAASWGARPVGTGVGLVVVALSVGTVADLPTLLRESYRPVSFPTDWPEAVGAAGAGDGAVLSLPWQPLRRPGWRGPGPAFLDPTPRAVGTPVLTSVVLTVSRDGRAVEVDDAPTADGTDWARGVVSDESLRRHGVTRVVEWLDTPGALPVPGPGWVLLHGGPAFRVWDVSRASRAS